MAITAVAAEARLRRMVAAATRPQLTDEEITDLLVIAERADSLGTFSTDPEWVNTYDLNAAAAEGWRWKAAKVSGDYDAGQDGGQYSRSQVHTHCLKMAAYYETHTGELVGDRASTRPRTYTIGLDPAGIGLGYGPIVTDEDGRVLDPGGPTLIRNEDA